MREFRNSLVWGILLTLAPLAVAHAIPPPRPGILDRVTGRFLTTGERFPLFPKDMRTVRPSTFGGAVPLSPVRRGTGSAAPLAIGTSGNATVRPLVLLIDFADRPHTQGGTQLASRFFASGPRDFSVKNYWEEASYTRQGTNIPGKTFRVLAPVAPAPEVVGWLRAGTDFSTSVTSYSQCLDAAQGANLANIRQLIADAVVYLDSAAGRAAWNVTFSQYRDPAGTAVQALVFVHPGYGAEDSGSPSLDVYSHGAKFAAPVTTSDGTTVEDYITVPESQFYNDTTGGVSPPLIGAGVIVHEMGHLLGLPDLYPTGATGQVGGGYSGVGVYDVMGFGMWGSVLLIRADNPAHPSAWSKAQLGWVVPQVQSNTALSLLFLRPFEYYPDVHQVFPSSIDPTQWFLIENRQRVDTALAAPAWLFDNFLPGSGILIWHIDSMIADNAVIRSLNIVNNDNVYKGVDVEEANGENLLSRQFPVPPPPVTPNDLAPYFGRGTDYFSSPTALFSRDLPVPGVNQTNSTPIVGVLPFLAGASRPPDVGDNVTITNFIAQVQPLPDGSGANYLFYDLMLSGTGGGGGAAAWKTFNIASTLRYPIDNTTPVPPGPMRSDDILSVAFDSGNNAWMGSRDQGIFRFLGTRFLFLGSSEGLPSVSPGATIPLSPIRSMAFEDNTGSMWVGTEAGLFKMRDAGAGFRVQASFTTASAAERRMPSNVVQAIAVRKGTDAKYAGTPAGLVRILDRLTDSETDDTVVTVLVRGDGNEGLGNGNVTAVAIDDNGTADPADDVVWAGFSNGIVARSRAFDPARDSDFRTYLLAGSPRINALTVDKKGTLWIATDRSGVEAFDLGETIGQPNLRDPFDFNNDDDRVGEAYLGHSRGLASDNVTGIAAQSTTDPEPVLWFSHGRDLNNFQGGASRFDANRTNDNTTAPDERVAVFFPEAGILPENQVNGPSSTWLTCAVADSAGNVWFGSTVPAAEGVSRYGNAGILSLDSSNYVNVTAVAKVTLQDDGLNSDRTAVNRAIVFVTSGSDTAGFLLELRETGTDTGIFTGEFGFSLGATDRASIPALIAVQNGTTVTVSYFDANPRGTRTASATWKSVYPFSDSLFVEDFRCFIATAAYGSTLAPEVRAFRRFRDEVLLSVPAGKALVSLYYRYSPPLAVLVARSPVLRSAARFVLAPAAFMAGVVTGTGKAEGIAVFAVMSGLAALLVVAPRRGLLPGRGRTRKRIARQI